MLEPGTILFDKYRIERVLGKGGMGIVLLATHVDLEDRFAIKVLTGELDHDLQQRFLREARAAAQIKSDHIARVIDVGTLPDGGKPYMIMEYLDGTDLAGLIDQRGAMPIGDAVDLVLQACIGLTEAHAKNFVHRDIKPANLFVQTTSDGRRVVKLLDFGISKQQDVAMTSTRAVLGTPAYMAPEQWRSAKDADARADLWSIGVVLHELLTGHRPFKGDSVPEMCSAVLAEDPPPLRLDNPALDQVVAKCLEKEPADRYQRIPELARDLAPFASDPAAANALVDRMDRVAGRPSSPSSRAPRAKTAPTVADRPTAPAPVALADTAVATQAAPAARTRNIAIAGAAAVVAAVAIYAVSRSGDDSRSPAPTQVQAVAATPRRGGMLRVAMNRDDETTIALYAGQPTRTQAAMRMVMERLVIIDEAGGLQDSVLKSVDATAGDKTLVLELRPNLVFHDSPCAPAAAATGKDLEFSIEEAIALHQLDFDIASMTPSALGLTIELKSPVVSWAHALSHVWLVPAVLRTCEADRKALKHPIGTGPFRWVDSPIASTRALARWDRYWKLGRDRQPLPYLDRVELVQIGEASTALSALREDVTTRKAIHVFIPSEKLRSKLLDTTGLTPKLQGEATRGLELGTRTNEPDVGLWLLEFTKPTITATQRRAIALAIDRPAVERARSTGASSPVKAYGRFLQRGVLGFDGSVEQLELDVATARELLGSSKLTLRIGYSHSKAAAEVVAKSLVDAGIEVELEEIELRDQSGVLRDDHGRFDAILISRWGKKLGNELISIGAYDQRRSPELSKKLIDLAKESVTAKRAAAYRKIEATLLAELPAIPIATLDPTRIGFAMIVRPGVEGLHDRTTGHVPHDDELTFAETWLNPGVAALQGVGSAN